MKIEIDYVDIDSIIPSEYNPRYMTDNGYNRAYKKMSSPEWEWDFPLIVNRLRKVNDRYVLVAGHQRYEIAKMLYNSGDERFKTIPVKFKEYETIIEEQAANVDYNKNWGEWDNSKLANLNLEPKDFVTLGFSYEEISNRLDIKRSTVIELNVTDRKIEDLNVNPDSKDLFIGYSVKVEIRDEKIGKKVIKFLKENGLKPKIKEIWE